MTAGADVEFVPLDPGEPEARAAVDAYLDETARLFETKKLTVRVAGEADAYREPHGVFLVGRAPGDGTVVACGAVRALDGDVGEVKRMWVRPDHRRQGLGVALLDALEAHAARLGYRTLRLDTNAALTPAIGLYEHRGYRAIDRYNDNPDATHFFEKRLA
jgi:GNAT superfamily N-acetyltransferase